MKILFVADARSQIALNWIRYFIGQDLEVHIASSFPAEPVPGAASFHVVPMAFSGAAATPASGSGSLIRKLTSPQLRTLVRQYLGILTLDRSATRLAEIIAEVGPDIVHAMRIPYEGMTTAMAFRKPQSAAVRVKTPLLISIWGNDFTLHARANPLIAQRTRMAMQQATALHADCERDIRLAVEWGFPGARPYTVLPGGGGVQSNLFYPPAHPPDDAAVTVVQPRGMRAYVQNETFFKAIPLVIKKHPETRFVLPAMAGEAQAEAWMEELGLQSAVDLLPKVSREEMAGIFRRAQVMLSPTTHDGTPNTLLEALACGCFPVAGDLESIREWITPGQNGYLVDPLSPKSIAEGLIAAIENPELRRRAVGLNQALIREKADFDTVMKKAGGFYRRLLQD